MLQKEFFQVQPFNPKIIPLSLVYERNEVGAFTFLLPNEYNYVKIELAGACGGRSWNSDGGGIYPSGTPGRGAILEYTIPGVRNRTFTGIIGARPTMTYASEYIGGAGYNNGENSNKHSVTIQYIAGGGGGGSSEITVDSLVYEACAGGGASNLTALASETYGGKGGGQYGGARQTASDGNGKDATDPGRIGFNAGNGYIKIWGGYNPYYD